MNGRLRQAFCINRLVMQHSMCSQVKATEGCKAATCSTGDYLREILENFLRVRATCLRSGNETASPWFPVDAEKSL